MKDDSPEDNASQSDEDNPSKKKKGFLGFLGSIGDGIGAVLRWIETGVVKTTRPVRNLGTIVANNFRTEKKPIKRISASYTPDKNKLFGVKKNKLMNLVAAGIGIGLLLTPAAPLGIMMIAGAATKAAIDSQGGGKSLLEKGQNRKKFGALAMCAGAFLALPLPFIGLPMLCAGALAYHQGKVEVTKAQNQTNPVQTPATGPVAKRTEPVVQSSQVLSPAPTPRVNTQNPSKSR